MQGNSRIMIESQQDTNGVGVYSHNAFYQPFNPSYNTLDLSLPSTPRPFLRHIQPVMTSLLATCPLPTMRQGGTTG